MARNAGFFAQLAVQHGLARAPLFRQSDAPSEGEHEVLLDGAFGSFAVSLTDELDPLDASSWAWSSNVPHHVLIADDGVHVLRWDRPDEPNVFDKDKVLSEPTAFYDHLRGDKTTESRTIVQHSMRFFGTVRSMVHQSGLPDSQSMPAYLMLLAALVDGREPYGDGVVSLERAFNLPPGAATIASQLPQGAVENLFEQYRSLSLGNRALTTAPLLALRHASGAIFQEAHHILVRSEPQDLFNYVAPAVTRKPTRGAVHFTPPFLARAVCEQVFEALGDLNDRQSITVADIACGSAAFLVEALRALERLNFRGKVRLVGRDSSPIAIDMARFVLGIAGREWPGADRFHLDLAVQDTLRDPSCPKADVVVMNPPFTRWQDLSFEERDLATKIVPRAIAPRPDISLAFVVRALDILAPDGALASLLPAIGLDATSMSGWRRWIAERKPFYLTAVFDDQTIFSHAKVRVGAMVLASSGSASHIQLRAGNSPDDAGDALRALRRSQSRLHTTKNDTLVRQISVKAGRVMETHGEAELVPAGSQDLTRKAQRFVTTTVAELFEVQQGIRTGENAAFVLNDAEFQDLPEGEQAFFRPAITSRGIKLGRIAFYAHVFYPYHRHALEDELSLRTRLPAYYERFLLPHRAKLAARRGRQERWWELSERRSGLDNNPPDFVSKYWAEPGGFVTRDDHDTVVLQGFGWRLSDQHAARLNDNPLRREILTAYLAVLNSQAFFSLVAEHSTPTGGGQLDMSPRYLNRVPLPDLSALDAAFGPELMLLCRYAEDRYRRDAAVSLLEPDTVDHKKIEGAETAAAILLGLVERPQRPNIAKHTAPNRPEWLESLIESGLDGTDRAHRVKLLIKMQELAQEGQYREIDAALEQSPLSKLAETSIMTLLRGTYRFRSQLRHWKAFRDDVADEFERRGAAVKKLLVGLYE